MPEPILVYISGPYTQGDVALNVSRTILFANQLRAAGLLPYVPHLSHFWHLMYPHEYEYWLQMDLEWVARCDVLLRLSGDSPGADREVAHARELGKPVVMFADVSPLRDTWAQIFAKAVAPRRQADATVRTYESHFAEMQSTIEELRMKLAGQIDSTAHAQRQIDAMKSTRDARIEDLEKSNEQLREDRHRLASLFEKHTKDAQAIIEEIKPWG